LRGKGIRTPYRGQGDISPVHGKHASSHRARAGPTRDCSKSYPNSHLTGAEREIDDASYTELPARIREIYRIISDICVDSSTRRARAVPAANFPNRFSGLSRAEADAPPVCVKNFSWRAFWTARTAWARPISADFRALGG
jgi:hypothetical protein